MNTHEEILYNYYQRKTNLFLILSGVNLVLYVICAFGAPVFTPLGIPGLEVSSLFFWGAAICLGLVSFKYSSAKNKVYRDSGPYYDYPI